MKQRLDELTIFRAIACLSVIMVHVSAVPFDGSSAGNMALVFFGYLNRAFKYTTPAFIFLSGFMQYYNYWQKPFDFAAFLKKRFGPIFWPYLAATSLYYTMQVALGSYGFTPIGFIKRLFLADANYHLYFVAIILQMYLMMPLIMGAFKKFNDHAVLIGSLIINLISREFFYFQYSDRFFLNYLFFFILGAYVVRHMEQIKKLAVNWIGLSGLVYGGIAGYYGYQFVSSTLDQVYWNPHLTSMTWFVFSTAAIAVLYGISLKALSAPARFKKWTQQVSTASYWIYLLHPMVLYVSVRIWRHFGIQSTSLAFLWNGLCVFGAALVFANQFSTIKTLMKRMTLQFERT